MEGGEGGANARTDAAGGPEHLQREPRHLQNYSCFAEEDFRAAFDKQSGGGASVSLDKVGPMLEEVFGGFAPEQEMEALLGTLQHFGGEISFDHIMTSVAAVAGAP